MDDPRKDGVERRDFLRNAAAAPLAYAGLAGAAQGGSGDSQAPGAAFPGLIIRQQRPDNLELPFATLNSFITPTDRFYVRNHFEVPRVDVATWRLRVEGAVERPLELSFEDVRQLPSRTMTALLEC